MSVTLANRRGWNRVWLTALAGTILFSGTVGCASLQGVRDYVAYNDITNDFVMGWRNSAWSTQAWAMRKHQFADQPFLNDFGQGFRAGYADVASGSGGCTPGLPPRKYWNWKYQTPEGQGKVAAWFAGYPHGAKAAEEECAGHHSNIQVSESLRAEYRLGHTPPYPSPLNFHNPNNWCPPQEQGIVPGGMPLEAEPLKDPLQGAAGKVGLFGPESDRPVLLPPVAGPPVAPVSWEPSGGAGRLAESGHR